MIGQFELLQNTIYALALRCREVDDDLYGHARVACFLVYLSLFLKVSLELGIARKFELDQRLVLATLGCGWGWVGHREGAFSFARTH